MQFIAELELLLVYVAFSVWFSYVKETFFNFFFKQSVWPQLLLPEQLS